MYGQLIAAMMSGGGFKFQLTNLTELRTGATGNVITGFRLVNSGQAHSGDGNPSISWNNIIANEWQAPLDATNAALYEVEATEVSRSDPNADAIFTGTVGAATWQDLAVTKTWTLEQPEGVGINAEWVIDFDIRNKASTLSVATCRVTLQSRVV